jgi:DNA-binding transcriptional LysR family regulator
MMSLPEADRLAVASLRSFCLVYEKQSYSAAARAQGLSVPTVWAQVQLVARQYQVALFQRRGRRVEPTAAAEALYAVLRPLLATLDSTFELVQDSQQVQPRTITVVSGARLLLEDLGPPLARFCQLFPQVRLRLVHHNDGLAASLVATGEADLALTLQPLRDVGEPRVRIERAFPIEFLAIFPRRHPLARRARLTLEDLLAYPLVVGHSGTFSRQLFEQALYRRGLGHLPRIVAETDSSAFTAACVRAGMGVGLIAGRPDGFLCQGLASRSLREELGEAWIVFLLQRGKLPSRPLEALIEAIRGRARPAQQRRPRNGPSPTPLRQ